MGSQQFQTVSVDMLSHAHCLATCDLIVRALPHYFEPVRRTLYSGTQVLAENLGFPAGAAEKTIVALHGGDTVAGIVSGNDSQNLQRAQMAYMQTLFRWLDDEQRTALRKTLADTAGRTETVSEQGWYLAGISVAAGFEGTGLADHLMDIYYDQAPGAREYSLHVHRDNARAVSFYRRHGFDFQDTGNAEADAFVYRVMHREGPQRRI